MKKPWRGYKSRGARVRKSRWALWRKVVLDVLRSRNDTVGTIPILVIRVGGYTVERVFIARYGGEEDSRVEFIHCWDLECESGELCACACALAKENEECSFVYDELRTSEVEICNWVRLLFGKREVTHPLYPQPHSRLEARPAKNFLTAETSMHTLDVAWNANSEHLFDCCTFSANYQLRVWYGGGELFVLCGHCVVPNVESHCPHLPF